MHASIMLEAKRSGFGTGIILANDQLYIRTNLPALDASIVAGRNVCEIAVEERKNPRSFKVKDRKALDLETTAMVLQCSGNGRGLFQNKPSGTPWQVGAAVQALGSVADGKQFMTGTAGEKLPDGIDPKCVIAERLCAGQGDRPMHFSPGK